MSASKRPPGVREAEVNDDFFEPSLKGSPHHRRSRFSHNQYTPGLREIQVLVSDHNHGSAMLLYTPDGDTWNCCAIHV